MEQREPQYPKAGCKFPSAKASRRLLRADSNPKLYNAAVVACADAEEPEDCVKDVMLSGEIDFASAW